MASESALIFFTLSPGAEGRRKSLGFSRPEQAARVFGVLQDHIISTCSRLDGVDLLIATPDRTHPTKAASNWIAGYLPQRGESFGESLRLAVDDAFSLGYRRVVVIGNDSPEISRAYLQDAFRSLATSGPRAAVLGPAKDGGYALLGLTAGCPEIFAEMPWGSSRVACLTEGRLAAHGFAVKRLAPVADIDDPRGLARFLIHARKNSLAALARSICAVLAPVTVRLPPNSDPHRESLLTGWINLRAPPVDFA